MMGEDVVDRNGLVFWVLEMQTQRCSKRASKVEAYKEQNIKYKMVTKL